MRESRVPQKKRPARVAGLHERTKAKRRCVSSQSPTAGRAKSHAWNFELIIRNLEVGNAYSFAGRRAYETFVAPGHTVNELRARREGFRQTLGAPGLPTTAVGPMARPSELRH